MSQAIAAAAAPGRLTRWFAFLGGGVAWTLHLMLSYTAAEFGCVSGLHHRVWMGASAVTWMLIAISGACLLSAVAATGVAYRADAGATRSADTAAAEDAAPYLLRAGLIANAIFTLVILVQCLPILYYLRRCW